MAWGVVGGWAERREEKGGIRGAVLTLLTNLCGAGKYSATSQATSVSVCQPCPGNSASQAGSDDEADCVCNAGATGPDGGECTLCQVNQESANAAKRAAPRKNGCLSFAT